MQQLGNIQHFRFGYLWTATVTFNTSDLYRDFCIVWVLIEPAAVSYKFF